MNTAAERMRMRQIWHFRFAQFFLVLCLFSRKFYKVCNKQLSLLLQQKSLKEYAFFSLNFISLSGKEIPKILAAMQGVRTSVSVIINRCLLFSSSWHRRLVVRMWCKPSFFVHCGVAFVTPPCTCRLVSMISRPYGIQNSIKSRWNTLFPKAVRMIFSGNRALGVRRLWLNSQKGNTFCRHNYDCFCWPSHILLLRKRITKPTQHEELREKKFARRARTRPKLSHFL